MGFRKGIYDVEEKGLDPTKAHSSLSADGRLTPAPAKPVTPVISEPSDKSLEKKVKPKSEEEVSKKEDKKATLDAPDAPKEASTANQKLDSDKSNKVVLSNALKELPEKLPEKKEGGKKEEKKSASAKKTTRTKKPKSSSSATK